MFDTRISLSKVQHERPDGVSRFKAHGTVRRIVFGGLVVLAVIFSLAGCGKPREAASVPKDGAVTTTIPASSSTDTEAAKGVPYTRNMDAKAFASELEALLGKSYGNSSGSAGFMLIDVRTPAEFASGHIAGAVNLDISAPDFESRIKELPRGDRYLVYCRSGNRSSTALGIMESAGFSNASHLAGGIGAWTSGGEKLVQ